MNFSDITLHGYDERELRRQFKKEYLWRYNLKMKDVTQTIKDVSVKFVENSFRVNNIEHHCINGKTMFTMGTIYDALTIRRTNDILQASIQYNSSNREDEIQQLWSILSLEKNNSIIVKGDISSFFESLPLNAVLSDLMSDSLISPSVYKHLNSIHSYLKMHNYDGLPRGLPISASLSEYAMLKFDQHIRTLRGCIYYSRYVDDFVLIMSEKIPNLLQNIEDSLPYGLSLNMDKTREREIGSEKNLDFLGYSFPLNNPTNASISHYKISRIKKRIMLSIKRYLFHEKSFRLLKQRLQFLSSITKLKMADREKEIAVGIRYQYSMCKEEVIVSQLKILDTFLKSILYSKRYSVSLKLRRKLKKSQYLELLRISFVSSYLNKITMSREMKVVSKIKDAWRYE